MAATERDFSNYILDDNVHELANELLPEMAEAFEVDLGDEPNSEALGRLVGVIGSKKTLRENEQGAKAWLVQQTGSEAAALSLAAGWMERSGVQVALNRSLWTPEIVTPDGTPVVLTGAVANWQDRAAGLVAGLSPRRVFIAVGQQVMDSGTERVNPNVVAYEGQHGSYPTQAQYAERFIDPLLTEVGHDVRLIGYDTTSGDEIATSFAEEYENLLSDKFAFARVANAGIQLAVQFRSAAQRLRSDFDSDPTSPQAYVVTDAFPVAHTSDEVGNAREFQSPYTGIRQVALTGKLLVEAAVGA